jgi:hypothetical protein
VIRFALMRLYLQQKCIVILGNNYVGSEVLTTMFMNNVVFSDIGFQRTTRRYIPEDRTLQVIIGLEN